MKMLNEFPEHRRTDPRRQAEMQVYDQLAGSGAPGAAIYEIRAQRDAPELDFAVWIEDVAHFGIQVKGGRYAIEGGRWFLYTNGERELMQDPVKLTWDAAMSIRAALWTRGRYKVYMVAVLAFPDMPDPDPRIQERADNCRVNVLWGSGNLVERLTEVDDVEGIYSPPTARHIQVGGGGPDARVGGGPPRCGRRGPVTAAAPFGNGPDRPPGGHPARRRRECLHRRGCRRRRRGCAHRRAASLEARPAGGHRSATPGTRNWTAPRTWRRQGRYSHGQETEDGQAGHADRFQANRERE